MKTLLPFHISKRYSWVFFCNGPTRGLEKNIYRFQVNLIFMPPSNSILFPGFSIPCFLPLSRRRQHTLTLLHATHVFTCYVEPEHSMDIATTHFFLASFWLQWLFILGWMLLLKLGMSVLSFCVFAHPSSYQGSCAEQGARPLSFQDDFYFFFELWNKTLLSFPNWP